MKTYYCECNAYKGYDQYSSVYVVQANTSNEALGICLEQPMTVEYIHSLSRTDNVYWQSKDITITEIVNDGNVCKILHQTENECVR